MEKTSVATEIVEDGAKKDRRGRVNWPKHRREKLLADWQTEHAGQRRLDVRLSHAEAPRLQEIIRQVAKWLQSLLRSAEQWTAPQRCNQTVRRIAQENFPATGPEPHTACARVALILGPISASNQAYLLPSTDERTRRLQPLSPDLGLANRNNLRGIEPSLIKNPAFVKMPGLKIESQSDG